MEESSLNGLCERFMYDIQEYLDSKFQNIPAHVSQEVAVHIANRFGVSVVDILNERDREWRRTTINTKYNKKLEERCERLKVILKEIGWVNGEFLTQAVDDAKLTPNDMRWLMDLKEI